LTRIVHTADWHLGARLIDCDRADEHRAFLDWFLARLGELQPNLLIVAGDIFDSANPPQEALKLYYSFLGRLSGVTKCQTLILGGNHDSPATLHAPRDVLQALDVRVIAAPPENPADALLELEDAIVCAVPFLRERDIRTAAPGQTSDEISATIRAGIDKHYRSIHAVARAIAGSRLIVATGHLTAVGSQTSPSERAIHVGNLGAVDAACFDGFAYTALGHIHRPQSVGANDCVRYAGSPIPLSFAEADCPKEFRVIDIDGARITQHAITIPLFRPLLRITTTTASLKQDLRSIAVDTSLTPWVELTVCDGRSHPDLDRQVREAARDLPIRVLKILTTSPKDDGEAGVDAPAVRSLEELRPEEVFAERLRRKTIDPDSEEGKALVLTFAELLSGMRETDPNEHPATE
jgi:exonuclease SbcD